ncbi:MAG: hypothetical protein E7013_04580 [Alphaproteobacteria bacterium]|nr:hypothetical protein [Alphaproteobacteria bacterium]
MKIIDKIKKDKITPLMCVTGSFGPISDWSNVPYFCFWAIGSFFIVMPIVLYFLLNLKAKKKSESVSFVRFIGFLLLSYPLYVIFLYFFLRVFGESFYGTFMEWRKAIFMTLLFAGLISFVLFLLKKVKYYFSSRGSEKKGGNSFKKFFVALLFSFPIIFVNLLFANSRKRLLVVLFSFFVVLFILFLLKKVKWPYFFIPFLMVLGCLWMMLFFDFC